MYSLEIFPQTVANSWINLLKAIRLQDGTWALCPELEERLIHFTCGRRIGKGESVPAGHRALHTKNYIDTIKRFEPRLEELYEDLCEVVHPAAASVEWMVRAVETDGEYDIFLEGSIGAAGKICDLLDKFRDPLVALLMAGTNYALVTLKVLQKLPLAEFDLDAVERIDLSHLPVWQRIDSQTKTV